MTIAIVLLSLLHLRFGGWQDISASESGKTSPGSLLSGEWQDISASGSGLVKAKLELLEKEFDRLLDPLDKLNSKSGPSSCPIAVWRANCHCDRDLFDQEVDHPQGLARADKGKGARRRKPCRTRGSRTT